MSGQYNDPYWKVLCLIPVPKLGKFSIKYNDYFDACWVADVNMKTGEFSLKPDIDEEIPDDHSFKAFKDSLNWITACVQDSWEKKRNILEHSFACTYHSIDTSRVTWKFFIEKEDGTFESYRYKIDCYNNKVSVFIRNEDTDEFESFDVEGNCAETLDVLLNDIEKRFGKDCAIFINYGY